MHPWHDLDVGEKPAEAFTAVIETPLSSRVKYALDADTGLLAVKRILFSAMQYPANYGFIPRTLSPDGDALDVLVLGQHPIEPLTIVRARAIGLVEMREGALRDDKIVAVHVDDPVFAEYERIDALPAYLMREVRQFFIDYRALEHTSATVGGVRGRDDALRALEAARQAYRTKFGEARGS
jgi:inorganic pyrophosphatase